MELRALVCWSLVKGVLTFAPQKLTPSPKTLLSAKNDAYQLGATLSSVFAGLTFASQVSFAALAPENPREFFLPISEVSSSSTVVALETMDFSMPSYKDAIENTVKAKGDPPSFNPFESFEFSKVEVEPVVPKKEEVKTPSLSVPNVELPKFGFPDSNKEDEDDSSSKVEIPKLEIPKVELPKFSMPKFGLPKVETPEYDLDIPAAPTVDSPIGKPQFSIPKVDIPEIPKFDVPKFDGLKVDIPKFDLPKFDLPKFDLPKVDVPKVDFDIPKVDIPKIDIPIDLPKISLPNPFAGTSTEEEVPLEPREVRDERARATRQDFLAADQEVKDAEEVLKALKEIRSIKKQAANEAKDLACADRFGGKFICLRNPFTAGF